MSGISRITAYEIFANPNDLEIFIGQENEQGKWAIVFERGPGHNFKLLLDTAPVFEKPEEAIVAIKNTLEIIVDAVTKEAEDPNGFIRIDKEELIAHPENVLSARLIERIVADLEKDHVASTWKGTEKKKN